MTRDRRYSSLADKSLFIAKAVVSDSGRYFCNKERAADLTVIPSEGNKTTTTTAAATTRNTTAKTSTNAAAPEVPQQLPSWVFGVVAFLLLLLFLIIVYFTQRWFKRRGSEERIYDEIQDDGSNRQDPTYDTVPDLPPVTKMTVTSLPNESPYSLIGNHNKGEQSAAIYSARGPTPDLSQCLAQGH
ncbi:uncharacterized protein LOC144529091 isoform X2 [Sander vitreus]